MVTLNSAKIETKEGATILQLFFFRPPTKLQEGNVFNRVCLSVCPQGSHVTNDHNALDLTVEGPPSSVPLSMFKRVQLGLHCTGTPPVAKTGHLFKLVHLRIPPFRCWHLVATEAHRSTSGWYSSYWNAFFFAIAYAVHIDKQCKLIACTFNTGTIKQMQPRRMCRFGWETGYNLLTQSLLARVAILTGDTGIG